VAKETGSDMAERAKKFKELIKSGMSVNRALKESKLHPRYYKQHYMEIWSDPELEPYRPERFKQMEAQKPPEVVEAERRLAQYGIRTEVPENLKSNLEKELEELELRRQSVIRAAQKALRLFGSMSETPPPPPQTVKGEEKPRDVIDEFESAYKDFESKRTKIKETLEKMGLKVEDMYMKRDEVEKLIEETKRKAVEEALDDKRIEAVSKIVSDAIAQIVGMFKPVVQAYFSSTPAAGGEGEGGAAEQGGEVQHQSRAETA
jgi:prefoldin subunit 5